MERSDSTGLKESSTRKKIDQQLINLGWNTDEESTDCNVVTERTLTQEQKKRLRGKEPDYVLYQSHTQNAIAVIDAKAAGENLEKALKETVRKYAEPLAIPVTFVSDGTFVLTWHLQDSKELTIDGELVRRLVSEEILLKFVNQGADIKQTTEQVKYSREQLIKIFKWANNMLRKEGLRGLDRFVEFANILFLKLISEIENDRQKNGETRKLDQKYCWEAFAGLSAETMTEYINNTVLPHLVDRYNRTGDVFQRHLQIKNPQTVKAIADELSKLTLLNTASDIKGDAFEYFLKSLGSSNDLGEYFTPRHIVKIIVKLVSPRFGEKVYDPATGTGGFLIEAFKHIKSACKLTPENVHILKEETIYGNELTNTARIAKMNMILADDGHTNIHERDSLKNPVKNEYDVVLTNFPFSQTTDWGHLYGLNTKDGNVVFLKHIVDALRDEDGRAGVIAFQGVLYDKISLYRDIRKQILETCNLEAVIKLHNYVFRPYSGANTSILVFTKGKPTKKIWFFNVENDGFEKTSSKRGRPPIEANDLDILETIWATKEDTEKSWTVDFETIKTNDYILDAERYKPRRKEVSRFTERPIMQVCSFVTGPVKRFSGERKYLDTGHLKGSYVVDFDTVTY